MCISSVVMTIKNIFHVEIKVFHVEIKVLCHTKIETLICELGFVAFWFLSEL